MRTHSRALRTCIGYLQIQKEKVLRVRHDRISHVPNLARLLEAKLLKETMGSLEARVGPFSVYLFINRKECVECRFAKVARIIEASILI